MQSRCSMTKCKPDQNKPQGGADHRRCRTPDTAREIGYSPVLSAVDETWTLRRQRGSEGDSGADRSVTAWQLPTASCNKEEVWRSPPYAVITLLRRRHHRLQQAHHFESDFFHRIEVCLKGPMNVKSFDSAIRM